MFGELERLLSSTCYALTRTTAELAPLAPEQIPDNEEWCASPKEFQTSTMHVLTDQFVKLLGESGRVPHTVRDELRERLVELTNWRNALCHGA